MTADQSTAGLAPTPERREVGNGQRQQPEAGSRFLDETLLERFRARAPIYDRENRFFQEDFQELAAAGYLKALLPTRFGGQDWGLADVISAQSRLAEYAPATALAVNMHLYWTGTATFLWRRGDASTDWILEEAANGKIFAAGHGEPGNDLGLASSTVIAEPLADGAYRFTGHKIFTSLAPAWDWLGVHALDSSDPAKPKVVHAFLRRSDPGIRTVETWDAHGMRATRSDDTILEGAIAEPAYVSRVLPVGLPEDPFTDALIAAAVPPIAAVYHGIARRAFDLAAETAKSRVSSALGGKTYAHHPFTQLAVSESAIDLDSIWALLDRIARDWDAGVNHGPLWLVKILAAKQHAVDGARRVVDRAAKVVGARSLLRANEIERLVRDVRSGPFHPPNTDATHDLIGKILLGVLP